MRPNPPQMWPDPLQMDPHPLQSGRTRPNRVEAKGAQNLVDPSYHQNQPNFTEPSQNRVHDVNRSPDLVDPISHLVECRTCQRGSVLLFRAPAPAQLPFFVLTCEGLRSVPTPCKATKSGLDKHKERGGGAPAWVSDGIRSGAAPCSAAR